MRVEGHVVQQERLMQLLGMLQGMTVLQVEPVGERLKKQNARVREMSSLEAMTRAEQDFRRCFGKNSLGDASNRAVLPALRAQTALTKKIVSNSSENHFDWRQ